jgi:aerobic-type carbon monoxide dehydrogenase small subunit (CoxS/CutS family)
MEKTVTIHLNGKPVTRTVQIRQLLTDFIRYEAGLTGTHVGCTFEGVCGACTVHLDGEAIKSCLMLAVQCDGRSIDTVEGLARDGELHPLQAAFQRRHALQCGYCTSGMLMNGVEMIAAHGASLTEESTRHGLIGNICRCTGYSPIVDAILDVAGGNR